VQFSHFYRVFDEPAIFVKPPNAKQIQNVTFKETMRRERKIDSDRSSNMHSVTCS